MVPAGPFGTGVGLDWTGAGYIGLGIQGRACGAGHVGPGMWGDGSTALVGESNCFGTAIRWNPAAMVGTGVTPPNTGC
jgi:hypothetical protein